MEQNSPNLFYSSIRLIGRHYAYPIRRPRTTIIGSRRRRFIRSTIGIMHKVPFQLLELRVISAQDLAPSGPKNHSKNMKTYALIWIGPDRKLRTELDKKGGNNPNWNQKFVFRVENHLMDSDSASVFVEIYAASWLKPTLIGSVSVLIRDLIPPAARQEKRVVALQVRRHSGRPQGILSMGVALMDNTMRSMPLFTVLTGSTVGLTDIDCGKKGKNAAKLTRSLSDQTNLARRFGENKKKKNGSLCNCPAGGSPTNRRTGRGKEANSMLDGSLNSDIGPSPSVMAMAIAHGLYPLQQRPPPPPPQPGCSVLEDWTVEVAESSLGDQQSKMEQWLLQKHHEYEKPGNCKKELKSRSRRSQSADEGRFSCFGNACGCEFNIVCGNGGKKPEKKSSHG